MVDRVGDYIDPSSDGLDGPFMDVVNRNYSVCVFDSASSTDLHEALTVRLPSGAPIDKPS